MPRPVIGLSGPGRLRRWSGRRSGHGTSTAAALHPLYFVERGELPFTSDAELNGRPMPGDVQGDCGERVHNPLEGQRPHDTAMPRLGVYMTPCAPWMDCDRGDFPDGQGSEVIKCLKSAMAYRPRSEPGKRRTSTQGLLRHCIGVGFLAAAFVHKCQASVLNDQVGRAKTGHPLLRKGSPRTPYTAFATSAPSGHLRMGPPLSRHQESRSEKGCRARLAASQGRSAREAVPECVEALSRHARRAHRRQGTSELNRIPSVPVPLAQTAKQLSLSVKRNAPPRLQ